MGRTGSRGRVEHASYKCIFLMELSKHCSRRLCVPKHRIFYALRLFIFEGDIVDDVDAWIVAVGSSVRDRGCWWLSDTDCGDSKVWR